MSRSISGFTVVRNSIELDYCVHLSVRSMLPISEEVVICDSDSTDGTKDWLRYEFRNEPKVKIINRPWETPVGKLSWLIDWMQWVQIRLSGSQHLYLDADEVLDPRGYDLLSSSSKNDCYWMRRINYWGNVRQEAPHGTVCAHEVARFGPSYMPMFSDEIHDGIQFALPEPEMRVKGRRDGNLIIHHLGFLRKREALFDKVAANLKYFFGQPQDNRLIEAMNHPEKHWTEFCKFEQSLLPASVAVPEFCKDWLQERNAL